jgi:hypothetical protein
MKTKRIASMRGGLLTFLMAALIVLTIMGCEKEENPWNTEKSLTEAEYPEFIESQAFKVPPEGKEVSVFGGSVILNFQEGSVAGPTMFTISSFLLNHLDLNDLNMYNMGLYLEGESPKLDLKDVSMQVKYDLDPESWKKSAPGPADENLTIYHVSPDIYDYQTINSIGECCIDCSSTMIQGSINCCGYYVVGEN